ncbi:MAG: YfhO family protein, partial [Bacteroidales bacterium]|nr:YfhO family protein [Bacteroidales bacterium]
MKNLSLKKITPYIIAIILFLIITMIYLSPLLEGKKLKQDDIIRHKGMSKEIVDFREQTGEEALWTNSMFGGMPAYQISVDYKSNLISYIDKIFRLGLPHPAGLIFLYFIGFFILLLILGVDPWLSIAGSLAFAFSSYFFIIIEAGHNSKAHAIGYMAPVLAGIILCFRGKYLWGGILTALFLALELKAGHPQITYYLALLVIILGIFEFAETIRLKKYTTFIKSVSILIIAVILAVLTNITNLWATYEYGKYTIRGKSELTTEQENRTTGLDKDYATAWSYGVSETLTFLIPDFMGGSSHGELSEKSETFKMLKQNQVPIAQAKQYIKHMPLYWGSQPFTSGPVYIGAIMCFLFVLGLIIIKGKIKWWLLTATILSIMLAWGHNFMALTDFFLDYIPGYNKFRAVSMTLIIAELTIPLLGILALKQAFDKEIDKKEIFKALKISFYIVGGITLFFAIFPGMFFDFSNVTDQQYLPAWLVEPLQSDRKNLLRFDAIRSFIFIFLALIIIWSVINKKLKRNYAYIFFIILILADMWTIDKRYLNNDNFIRKTQANTPYQKTQADIQIRKDTDPNFRVLNLTVDPFADASTSYFHKSIGGYHGAKLRRYQELYDFHIKMNNINVLNMLNTKYVIQTDNNKQPQARQNPGALGNAWFVENYKIVENADEEIAALNDFDPVKTAIIDNSFKNELSGFNPKIDSSARIYQTEYKPNHLTYQYKSNNDQIAVFSEIYYDKGWNAYIDGNLMPHFRSNYVLRAMIVPKGEHTIEFKFEP